MKYIIKSGDTLSRIAKNFNIEDYLDIYKLNNKILKSPDDLVVGAVIEIPLNKLTPKESSNKIIIAEAMKYLGLKEGLNNDNIFGKHYNMNNVPYCSLFVSYVLEKTGYSTLMNLAGAGAYKKFCSYVPTVYSYYSYLNKVHKNPKEGDIIMFDFGSTYAEHIGFVVSFDKKTQIVTTIEANTSSGVAGSQSNGDGVYIRKRHMSTVKGCITPIQ